MKLVIDTNVFISAHLSEFGAPAKVLARVYEGESDLLITEAILDEYRRALGYDRVVKLTGMTLAEVDETIHHVREIGLMVASPAMLEVVKGDIDDNKFVECAVSGGADYIVSGDRRHLQPLKEYNGIPIVSPAEFVALLDAGML